MRPVPRRRTAFVGVSDHCGWAVFMTLDPRGTVIDRRRVTLVEAGIPNLPHHHDAQSLPIEQAVALIEKVRLSAAACAVRALDALSSDVAADIAGIAMRKCATLPPTVQERITDYRAQTRA